MEEIPDRTPAQTARADQQMARADRAVQDLIAAAAARRADGKQGLDLFIETALHCADAAARLTGPKDEDSAGAAIGLLGKAILRLLEERESAYRAGREERDDQIRSAARRLVARIIASAHLLDVPFTDAPDRSPWTQLKLDMNRLYEAVGIKLSVGIDQPAEPSLSFCGDLDVTTVLEALVQARSAGGDLGRAAEMVLQRHPPWMGSDGRYRLAGPGQIDDERADQPRKLGGP